MAEAAAIASIVGIAGFGIQLTKVLYDFGSTVSSAREQTGYIARHVDLYANVLDILTERIDHEEPILSGAAFDLIDELRYQSNDLFTKIEKLLPIPKEGRDEISFLQKVKWNFTQSKVALLVGELDYLRSTVHLLVTIIFTGRNIRSRRKRKATPNADSGSEVDDDLRKQGLKAQNALLAHHDALEVLPELEKEAERQGSSSTVDAVRPPSQEPSTRSEVICTSTTAFAELQQSLAIYTDPTQRQKVVLQRSVHVLQQLLQQWTTVDLSTPTSTEKQQTEAADRQQPASSPKESEGSKKTTASIPTYLGPAGSHQSEQESTTSPRNPETRRNPVPGYPRASAPSTSVEDWEDTPQNSAESSQEGKNSTKPTNQASNEQEHEAAMRRRTESEQHETDVLRRNHELHIAMETRQEELNPARKEAERLQLEGHRQKMNNIEMKRKHGVPAAAAEPADMEAQKPEKHVHYSENELDSLETPLIDHSKPSTVDVNLPPGWIKHWDPATSRFYYHDTFTRKTQWDIPYSSPKSARTSTSRPEKPEQTPMFARKSTPYSTTVGERTVVGEGSRPSVPPLRVTKSARSTKPQAEDLFAQVFGDLGGSNSNTLRPPGPCRACDGRGGREDKIEECMGCGGRGEVTVTRRSSGGHRRSVQRECRGCNGTGDVVALRYRCKVCLGTKKELVSGGAGAHFFYGKGGEDESRSERVQCASQ